MKKKILKDIKINSKEFLILKAATIFFKATPILFIIYLYINSAINGTDFFTLLFENSYKTVIFIVAMLGPFCGISTQITVDNLRDKKNIRFSKIILGTIAISQLVAGNMVGGGLVAVGLYKTDNGPKVNFKEFKEQLKGKKSFISIITSAFVIVISFVCRYAMIKMG